MQKKLKCIALISLVIWLSGCASSRHLPQVAKAEKSFSERMATYKAKKCCKSMDELIVTEFDDEIIFTMEENENLISLDGKETNYMLFGVTERSEKLYYGIRSFYVDHKFAFIPKVSVLDKTFNVLGSTHPSFIQYQHQSLVWDDSHFWLYFSIDNSKNSDVAYVVIHQQEELGSKFQISPRESTNIETTFINGQPISYSQNATSFSFPTLVSPSGILVLQKLNSWNKPINNSIFYQF